MGDPQAIETMWVSYSKANSFTCSGVQSGILHAQLPFADNEADNDHLKYQFFGELDKGPVSKQRKRRAKTPTKRYQDKGGRVRFCGTPALKSSQRLVYNTSMLYDYLAMISFGNSSWTFLNSFWNYPNVRLFLVEIDQ